MLNFLHKSKGFSLALGWWAARWLAHIGIIKYLEENNLKASEVSGTSMWAIIASLYAFEKTSDEMLQICSEINYLKLIDINLKKWLIAWNKIKDFFKTIFGETKIEDLKIKLKIVSTDINTWEKHIFESGLIVDAIRSSISIPWVIMPNKIWAEDFVDGWIVNNLPIEVLDNKNVIAVSVLRDITRKFDTKLKVLGIEIKHNIFWMSYQILQKSIDIMMKQNEDRSLQVDKNLIFIHPKFPKIDYYEFHRYEEIIKIWYSEATRINLVNQINKTFIF